jgi:uncharacterized protein YcbX
LASVVEIWRYPVKSMAGERLESCAVVESGLEGDRRWALVDGTANRAGKLLTIRQQERLLAYRASLTGSGLKVVYPDGETHTLDAGMVAHLAAEASRSLAL